MLMSKNNPCIAVSMLMTCSSGGSPMCALFMAVTLIHRVVIYDVIVFLSTILGRNSSKQTGPKVIAALNQMGSQTTMNRMIDHWGESLIHSPPDACKGVVLSKCSFNFLKPRPHKWRETGNSVFIVLKSKEKSYPKVHIKLQKDNWLEKMFLLHCLSSTVPHQMGKQRMTHLYGILALPKHVMP